MAGRPAAAAEGVESLGFGLAQLRVLLLGSSIWLVDGMELALVSVLAKASAADFEMDEYGRGLLSTIAFTGLAVGCVFGGFLGDTVGRKPPIVGAYAGVALFSLLTSAARSGGQLLCLRFAVGFCMGLGMPPSQTMQSELTPSARRMTMLMGRGLLLSAGQLLAIAMLVLQDPSLQRVDWRVCFAGCAPLPAVLALLALTRLPESPIFLASLGDQQGAEDGLENMRRLNASTLYQACLGGAAGGPGPASAGGGLSQLSAGIGAAPGASLRLQLSVVFGPAVWLCTLAVLLASLAANVEVYGHGYAEPQVLMVEKTRLPPAWQLLIECIYSGIGAVLVPVATAALSRRNALAASLATNAAVLALFAVAIRAPGASWACEVLFQGSALGIRVFGKMTNLITHQLSSEIYTARVAATGTAVCVGIGRVGAILAPMLFELCRHATGVGLGFYYVAATLALVAAGAVLAFLPTRLEDVGEAAARLCGELTELVPDKKLTA